MSLYNLACAGNAFDCTPYSTIYFNLIWYQFKMTQHNTLNVKFNKLEFNKLKLGTKTRTQVTLKLSSQCG